MKCSEKISVLLLEDDAEDHRLLVRGLRNQRSEYVIDWVQTLAEASEKLREQTYDVVLTDLSVPDSHGFDTVSKIKQVSGETPIIALTGSDDEQVENAILAAGAQDYLVKGELEARAVSRAIHHAVQRQEDLNAVNRLCRQLVESQQQLESQRHLLLKKNSRLRQLQKTAQEFVDNVSHDFRTPLTVIKDYVAIIREGLVGSINDDQQSMLDKVSLRADDLNNMVDDLLDVSKLESGLLGAWRRNIQVEQLIDQTKSLLMHRATVKNTELVVHVEENLPLVYCDAEKVGRVLTNLTVNAIKFSGSPGEVELRVEADPAGHQIVISVTDNGAGIDEESLQQIFQRFQQLNGQVKSTTKGFGLGLSIAQQLCQLNLGELSVKSKLGEGSTFAFTLPFADPAEILGRWLKLRPETSDLLRVIEIVIAPDVAADEFDSFLNCMLRGNDLLLRDTPHRWLLVMAVNPSEADRWFARTKKEFEQANRNRPLGPLPSYHAEVCCEWILDEDPDFIVEQFGAILQKEQKAASVRILE